ncbi:MAG: PilZ domain-containing protein [Salinisphaeraceae bacterium]|nr:PilZ domain-containing protein [Salinisphaeraceae bacterium]
MTVSYLYERRKKYRLRYPIAERPLLLVNDVTYRVSDLSEGGMRVVFDQDNSIPEDFPFNGTIRYVDGEEMTIVGKVLRSSQNGFTAEFEQGVSLKRIMRDQIKLRKQYPQHFAEG